MTEDLLLKLGMIIAWGCNTIIYYKRYNLNRKMMEWEEMTEKRFKVKQRILND